MLGRLVCLGPGAPVTIQVPRWCLLCPRGPLVLTPPLRVPVLLPSENRGGGALKGRVSCLGIIHIVVCI